MTAIYEQLDIETIRYRTQHGLPITQEQQRWLVEQVSGPLEGKKTRCMLCEGEGKLVVGELPLGGSVTRMYQELVNCDQCGGDGYILEQPKSDVRSASTKLRRRIAQGWTIVHCKGTAFVGMEHSLGGKVSLVEVKTSGACLTLVEADKVAAEIAEFLQARYDEKKGVVLE